MVEDLNAHFAQPIRLGDAALGRERITGVFKLDDPDAVLDRLALITPMVQIPYDGGVMLERARPRR